MTTAVDSSALIAILKAEPTADAWISILNNASQQGPLVICNTVAAEISALFASSDEWVEFCDSFHLHLVADTPASCWEAGQRFARYRRSGGLREHLIPDFQVAAHALHHADRLATSDRGFHRNHFSDLTVLRP